jgi:hypothetical protein
VPSRKTPTTLEEALAELARVLKREKILKEKFKKLADVNEQLLQAHLLSQKPKN